MTRKERSQLLEEWSGRQLAVRSFWAAFYTLAALLALVVLLWPYLAQAQDGGVPTALPPVTDAELLVPIQAMLEAGRAGKILLAVCGGLLILVRLVIRFGRRIPGKLGAWVGSSQATWVLPLAASISAALVAWASSPVPLGLDGVLGLLSAAVAAGLAAGGWWAKAAHLEEAKAAGTAAAAAVPDKAAAVDVLKGPRP